MLGEEVQVDIRSDRRLAQGGGEDGQTRRLIRQGDIDELIETTGTHEGRVDLVRSV